MRKLLVIALALGLLFGLFACGREPAPPESVPFDLAAYAETLHGYGEDFTKSNEALQPLLDYEGELPDRAVMAYMQYLYPACDAFAQQYLHNGADVLVALKTENYPFVLIGFDQFVPSYYLLDQKLLGKASPGMGLWLAQMVTETRDYAERDCAFYLNTAKSWYDFELGYPELAATLAETKYSFSTHPDFDYPLSEGQSERHVDTFLRRDGALPPLAEEDVQRLWADHEEVCEAFLSDQANKKYPFYDAVQADYQNRL